MYQALYRKWRPVDFDDVSGQPHVTSTLKGEIECGRLSHAYLFTGSRGTGKTSCAKILAKAVNCLHPVNGNPCGECEICRGIGNGSILDVIEIDAASNNGVDNIRDLREEVNFTPVSAKYRVYIIDEVHMLSIGAFNALLKTLEEPPAHVIFILATTEVHKLPATVLSRCQRFDFKRISPEDICARLLYVAGKEGANLTEEAAMLIARVADGGMRDALSLLDRCLVRGGTVDSQTVRDAAGLAGTEHLFEFSSFVANGDFAGALSLVTRLHNEACDIESLCTELTLHFRNLMVAKTVPDCGKLIVCSEQELKLIKQRAAELRLAKILECINTLCEASKSMKGASSKKIRLETAVVSMCSPLAGNESSASVPVESSAVQPSATPVKEPAAVLEQKPELPSTADSPSPTEAASSQPAPEQPSAPKVFEDGAFDRWPEIIDALKKCDIALASVLSGSSAHFRRGKLTIVSDNSALYDFIRTDSHGTTLKKCVFDVLGCAVPMSVARNKGEESAAKSPLENLIKKVEDYNNN